MGDTCKICARELQNESKLNRHLESIHDVYIFRCNKSSREFIRLYDLERHISNQHVDGNYRKN